MFRDKPRAELLRNIWLFSSREIEVVVSENRRQLRLYVCGVAAWTTRPHVLVDLVGIHDAGFVHIACFDKQRRLGKVFALQAIYGRHSDFSVRATNVVWLDLHENISRSSARHIRRFRSLAAQQIDSNLQPALLQKLDDVSARHPVFQPFGHFKELEQSRELKFVVLDVSLLRLLLKCRAVFSGCALLWQSSGNLEQHAFQPRRQQASLIELTVAVPL